MAYKDFDLSVLASASSEGFDAFFADEEPISFESLREASVSETPTRIRVAGVEDLKGFQRIASDTLIRKSERDLWSLSQTDTGDWVIERLFDDDGNPLKA